MKGNRVEDGGGEPRILGDVIRVWIRKVRTRLPLTADVPQAGRSNAWNQEHVPALDPTEEEEEEHGSTWRANA